MENIKYWVLCFLTSAATEQTVFNLFFKEIFGETIGYGRGEVLTCVFVIVILLILNKVSRNNENDEMPISSRFFIILTPIVSVVVVFLSYMAYIIDGITNVSKKNFGLLAVFAAVIGICAAVTILVYIFQQKEHFRVKADLEREYKENILGLC